MEFAKSKKSRLRRPYSRLSTITMSTPMPQPSMGRTSGSLEFLSASAPAARMNRQMGMFT